MKFKAAISVINGEKPYMVEVAIPIGDNRFLCEKFLFSRYEDATIMFMEYHGEFRKNPGGIMEYHLERKRLYDQVLSLPFSGF
jgi:hypothetical protein